MEDAGATQDGELTEQGDQLVFMEVVGGAVVPSEYVTEVTNVTSLCCLGAVGLLEWVVVGPGRCAALSQVTELMDVEPMLAW
eukprot:CAMPEP_0170493614 /NCGR_PEP_ID=MMETSP0208-20121228/14175_1 /TAXON_ID=197538 /ORGANISM="Strombidium inclinatum, Strain S3" /LENGTH=81 /DNA_ID=CAMNT_0010769565 /DNA_START=112 /DNA_END=354 /DNA_ORIENTATION=+